MKKFLKILFKILGKLILAAVIFFAATFTLYMVNGENKLIYYVVRPLLNKHYDSQVRDRRIQRLGGNVLCSCSKSSTA